MQSDKRAEGNNSTSAAIGPLVDTHAHVFDKNSPLASTAWHEPAGEAPIEAYMAELDAAGVHFAVLAAASIFGDYNDYMLAATCSTARLRTTVIVSPDIDSFHLRDMDAAGAVGIRLQFRNVAQPPDLQSFEFRRLFRRIADLGWHVHLHDEGARLAQFIPLIENAGPRLVIDHFGRPDSVDAPGFRAVLDAVERGNAWVKLSAPFRFASPELTQCLTTKLLAVAGTERLLWGSDWPFVAYEGRVTYQSAVRRYHELVPDPAARHEIDRTALKFYFS